MTVSSEEENLEFIFNHKLAVGRLQVNLNAQSLCKYRLQGVLEVRKYIKRIHNQKSCRTGVKVFKNSDKYLIVSKCPNLDNNTSKVQHKAPLSQRLLSQDTNETDLQKMSKV